MMIVGSSAMLSIRLNKEVEKTLENMAEIMKISKTMLVKEALDLYLKDKQDYFEVVQAMTQTTEIYPLEDVLIEFKNEL
jgi:predicted DNA-binding protein